MKMNIAKAAERLNIPQTVVVALRRDALRLRSWFTRECNGLERDTETGKCHEHWGYSTRTGYVEGWRDVADLETPARARIAKICAEHGLRHYVQTDPRGASLYVSRDPIDPSSYDRGVAFYA